MRNSRRLGCNVSDQRFLSAATLTAGEVVLQLQMARATEVFLLCSAVFKASTSKEEERRGKQEFKGLAQNLHLITGPMPVSRRVGKSFARIVESIRYHHQSPSAKRCSPCNDVLDGIRVAISMLMCPSIYRRSKA